MRLSIKTNKTGSNYTIIGDYKNLKGKRSTYVYESLGNDTKLIERFGSNDTMTKVQEYIDSLNRQECIYPENYIKAHFLENHDQTRLAAYVPDAKLRNHWNAFALFAKGIGFVYNGQEYSALRRPELFEVDTIDRSGEDISWLIKSMMKIKRNEICRKGSFFAREIRRGVVKAEYTYNQERLIGYFRLDGPACSIDSGIDEGEYKEELTGKAIQVFHGVLKLDETPVIFHFKRT